jgi:hypothetical protein
VARVGAQFLSVSSYLKILKIRLDERTKLELCSASVLTKEAVMFRAVVEEAAALASITLFVGMIVVWARVLGAA